MDDTDAVVTRLVTTRVTTCRDCATFRDATLRRKLRRVRRWAPRDGGPSRSAYPACVGGLTIRPEKLSRARTAEPVRSLGGHGARVRRSVNSLGPWNALSVEGDQRLDPSGCRPACPAGGSRRPPRRTHHRRRWRAPVELGQRNMGGRRVGDGWITAGCAGAWRDEHGQREDGEGSGRPRDREGEGDRLRAVDRRGRRCEVLGLRGVAGCAVLEVAADEAALALRRPRGRQ